MLYLKNSSILRQIDDNEACAVQRLILDLMGQSEVMDEWMDAIIERYFRGQSWPEMAREDRSQSDARSNVKCGLAVLHGKYPYTKYVKNKEKLIKNHIV